MPMTEVDDNFEGRLKKQDSGVIDNIQIENEEIKIPACP